ncbi:MAG TPA: ABC transporter permease [Candidatus Limnocylindrales bacterium]|nr:ABC transporter permease [Candidatus Limnocylindrales bacterium]
MTRYIVRRLIGTIPTLFVVSLLIYSILLAAPGGPEQRFAQNPKMTAAQIDAFRRRWGLDQPVPIQYCRWVGFCNPNGKGLGILISDRGLPNFLPGFLGGGDNGVLHGDLGYSSSSGSTVASLIGQRVLPTAILAGISLFVWIVLALITGIVAAIRRYGKADTAITVFNYVGFSFPTFWLGLMLIVVFAANLKMLPAGGMWDARTVPIFGSTEYWAFAGKNPTGAFLDLGRHLILPVITLVFVNIAGDSRFIRAAMIDALSQDFVRTARAKGVGERGVVVRHALRNALLPVVTNIALELPFLFAGAIATETIFSWPGMGLAYIQAVNAYDYPVLMGILVITAVVVVAANLLADILYAVVDPRISYG